MMDRHCLGSPPVGRTIALWGTCRRQFGPRVGRRGGCVLEQTAKRGVGVLPRNDPLVSSLGCLLEVGMPILALVVVLVSGCGPVRRYVLPPDAPAAMVPTEIVVVIVQDQLEGGYYRLDLTSMMLGGLIWMAIDAGVNSAREAEAAEKIASVRRSLPPRTLDKLFEKDLDEELGSVPWFDPELLRVETDSSRRLDENTYDASSAAAVLLIRAAYFLSPDHSALVMAADVTIYPKAAQLQAVRNAAHGTVPREEGPSRNSNDTSQMFRNHVSFWYVLPKALGEQPGYLTAWTANDAARLRAGLRNASKTVAQAISYELRDGTLGGRKVPDEGRGQQVTLPEVPSELATGALIVNDGDLRGVRTDAGVLYLVRAGG